MQKKEYLKVPLTEFTVGSILPVDLFRLGAEGTYLPLAKRGLPFSPRSLRASSKAELNWLYLKKEDYAVYVEFHQDLKSPPPIQKVSKLKIYHDQKMDLIFQSVKDGLHFEQFERAINTVGNALELSLADSALLNLIHEMEKVEALLSHSILVSLWSSLIANQYGWNNEPELFKVALCALFHDVGRKESKENWDEKRNTQLNPQQLKILESHTLRGRDMLESIAGLPKELSIVAMQHQELARGNGYPKGLRLEQIHPLARLIGLANQFSFYYERSRPKKESLADVFRNLIQSGSDYDPHFLKALAELVKN